MKNKLTIIIPTRERADTLYHTIRTCLNQTYSNYHIIVSDNFSHDNTKEVVESFNDDRLSYINTNKRCSMSENFDFALSHVKDGYVMSIGDDDGVLPNSLEYVNEIINTTKCDAVVSHNAFYSWPNTPNPNKLYWSDKSSYEVRNTKEWLSKYLKFNMLYTFDLPGVYCGFVKKEAIERMTKNGIFFRSATPDSYSALAMCFAMENYAYSYKAFAVHGSSSKSNGAAYLSKKKEEVGEEAIKFFKENTIPFHSDIIMTKAFRVCSLEALLQLKNNFPELTKGIEIDWKLFLSKVLTERQEHTKEEIEDAVMKMCSLHNVDYNEILSIVPSKYSHLRELSFKELSSKLMSKILIKVSGKNTKIEDASNYGVYDVYDAMILLKAFQK